ncbi:MAG: efflux RND transporter periplasmic adaptor subunit [Candidatus Polarisedimenticolaceae bacterium]|nr:efflux RND transporter periplasmic adaptor subunit [Candidatus Polarisedimenticolaceae bacterium]
MRLYRLGLLSATLIISQISLAAPGALATTSVTEQSIAKTVRFNGVVEAINQGTMTAQTEGQVQEIRYDVNDLVEKGSLIIRLKDNQQQANLARARALRHESQALLSAAKQEHRRSKDLYAKKLLPKSDLDNAVASLKAAQARLEAAEAGLLQAKEQLGYTRLLAPYSGIVVQRHIEVGEVAHPGQALITGLSLDRLRVIVNVPQSLISTLRKPDGITIELPDGGEVIPTGQTIFPYADSASNTIQMRLPLPDKTPNLLPGMFVKASFHIGQRSVLTVPYSSLVQRSELTALYIVDNDQISLRRVSIGEHLGDHVVLLSGVTAGEDVALDPIAAGIAIKQRASRHE